MTGLVKTKGLSAHENEELRRKLKQLLQAHFPDDQNAAALVMGMSQGYLSQFLTGERGAGAKIIIGLGKLEEHVSKEHVVPRFLGAALPTTQVALATDDPSADDAMRWRALVELRQRRQDVAKAFGILLSMKFDHSQRPVSWGDYYSLAMAQLEEERHLDFRRRLEEGGGKITLPLTDEVSDRISFEGDAIAPTTPKQHKRR